MTYREKGAGRIGGDGEGTAAPESRGGKELHPHTQDPPARTGAALAARRPRFWDSGAPFGVWDWDAELGDYVYQGPANGPFYPESYDYEKEQG